MKIFLFMLISLVLSCVFVIDVIKFSKDTKHFWLRFADCTIDALCIVGFAWISKGAF
jgi:hypothetical protein